MLQIAKILKSNGTDGGLLMSFRDIDPSDLSFEEPVYIEFDGLPVPFFFRSLQCKGNDKAIVHLNDVHNLRDAEELVGKAVCSDGFEPEEEEDSFTGLVGWTVKGVGTVSGFEDIPSNPCIDILLKDGREILTPIHDDLIRSINAKTKTIDLVIPEGLLR